MSDRPAILGGEPIRSMLPTWPPVVAATERVLHDLAASGEWGRYHGPHTERLVERLRTETGCEHVVPCSSGTAAVEFALRGLGVGPGDEVVLAAYDFESNFKNVLALGATPVLVDVHPEDVRIDVEAVEGALGDRTRAVIASHLHGGIADIPAIVAITAARGIGVVEDACQASGATVAGRTAGTLGDVGVFSFGGSKLLTAGRGGAVVTHRDDVAQRIRLAKERGNDVSPLSQMQAAVLLPQLDALADRHALRAANVERLRDLLAERPGLETFARSSLPDTSPAYYKLGFRYDPAAFDGLDRETFCRAMRAEGIPIDPAFRGLHLVHARRRFRAIGDLPGTTAADASVVVLHHPFLLEPPAAMNDLARALDRIRAAATMLQE